MKRSQRMTRWAAPVAVLAVLAYSAVTAQQVSAEKKEAPMLKDLANLDELKTMFNADEGSPRLLLLLSPT